MSHEATTSDPMRMTPEEMERYTPKAPMNADVEAMCAKLAAYGDPSALTLEAIAMLRRLAAQRVELALWNAEKLGEIAGLQMDLDRLAAPKTGEPVGYIDPLSLANLQAGRVTHISMVRKEDAQLEEVYGHGPADMPVYLAPVAQPCPYPVAGDDGTAKDCIEKGHCGCEAQPLPDYRAFVESLEIIYGTDAADLYPERVLFSIREARAFAVQVLKAWEER